MQLIDTHVGNTSDGMITVEFQGEGGEFVSVTMAVGDGFEGDAAVNRAKAVMVQLTTFAEDRDSLGDEWEHTQNSANEIEGQHSEPSEAKSGHQVVSSGGDTPSSAI